MTLSFFKVKKRFQKSRKMCLVLSESFLLMLNVLWPLESWNIAWLIKFVQFLFLDLRRMCSLSLTSWLNIKIPRRSRSSRWQCW